MMPYLTEVYGNPSSIYTIGAKAKAAVETARENIAKNLGAANPNEIYFTSGGSESDNWALKGVCHALKAKGKKHIISTAFEHHAVLHTLKKLEKEGFEIELLPVGAIGTITAQQVKSALRADTCLVTVMYANNEIGSILPNPEIGAVCKEKGVLFHTDAVQAAGHQQEIQVGADGKADGGPAGVRHAAEIGEAGDTHKQIAAHIAGFRAHGRDQGAHAPAAEIKAFSALLASFTDHHAGENHQTELQNDRCHDRDL